MGARSHNRDNEQNKRVKVIKKFTGMFSKLDGGKKVGQIRGITCSVSGLLPRHLFSILFHSCCFLFSENVNVVFIENNVLFLVVIIEEG